MTYSLEAFSFDNNHLNAQSNLPFAVLLFILIVVASCIRSSGALRITHKSFNWAGRSLKSLSRACSFWIDVRLSDMMVSSYQCFQDFFWQRRPFYGSISDFQSQWQQQVDRASVRSSQFDLALLYSFASPPVDRQPHLLLSTHHRHNVHQRSASTRNARHCRATWQDNERSSSQREGKIQMRRELSITGAKHSGNLCHQKEESFTPRPAHQR